VTLGDASPMRAGTRKSCTLREGTVQDIVWTWGVKLKAAGQPADAQVEPVEGPFGMRRSVSETPSGPTTCVTPPSARGSVRASVRGSVTATPEFVECLDRRRSIRRSTLRRRSFRASLLLSTGSDCDFSFARSRMVSEVADLENDVFNPSPAVVATSLPNLLNAPSVQPMSKLHKQPSLGTLGVPRSLLRAASASFAEEDNEVYDSLCAEAQRNLKPTLHKQRTLSTLGVPRMLSKQSGANFEDEDAVDCFDDNNLDALGPRGLGLSQSASLSTLGVPRLRGTAGVANEGASDEGSADDPQPHMTRQPALSASDMCADNSMPRARKPTLDTLGVRRQANRPAALSSMGGSEDGFSSAHFRHMLNAPKARADSYAPYCKPKPSNQHLSLGTLGVPASPASTRSPSSLATSPSAASLASVDLN